MKLSDFSDLLEIVRDGDFERIDDVWSETDLALAFADTRTALEIATKNSGISAIITNSALSSCLEGASAAVGVSDKPRSAFYAILERVGESRNDQPRIHETAVIEDGCRLADNVRVGAHAYVGSKVVAESGVTISEGATVGVDGILWDKNDEGITRCKHFGGVRLKRNATVLSRASIVNSIFPHKETEVGERSIVGIGATIGHEAWVGDDVIVSGGATIARAARIESNAWVGPHVFVRERIRVGRNATLRAGSIVISDVDDGADVSGNFALDHRKNLFRQAARSREREK